jgi:hypothetical protein
MPIRTVFFASLFFAFLTISLCADDIYVNNQTGDDRFNGRPSISGSANSGAVRTITRALEIARQGDRIVVEKTAVPYREGLTIQGARHSGTDLQPFEIVSNGAILDGTAPIPETEWEYLGDDVYRYQPVLKSHQQLYLNGRPAERLNEAAGQLLPLQWALDNGWIYFCTEPGKRPGLYSLACCVHQTGITLYQVHQLVIAGLVIQGFQLDAVNAHDGVSSAVIIRCKLRGNGRSGLSVGGASQVKLDQSLVGSNSVAQVRTEGFADAWLNECRILESDHFGPGMISSGGRIVVDGKPRQ